MHSSLFILNETTGNYRVLVLEYNAAALIFAHNHPSGVTEPSMADKRITETLKQALSLINIRVLDHFIVSSDLGCRTPP